MDRLVEARWTEEIHDEWIRNLAARAPAVPIERRQKTCRLMDDALPTAMVSEYENHVPEENLPDPNDRHIVAAGIAAGASIILTWNLRHFPAKELKKFGFRGETPDAFLSGLYDRVPDFTVGSLTNARRNLTKTHVSASDFIKILNSQKLIEFVKRAEKHLTEL